MKLAILTLALLAFLVSCGSDGEDGDVFIAVNWNGAPNYYNDSNPAIPAFFYAGTYYPAVVGTFSFAYEAWDQSVWSGSYEISAYPGEDGGLFSWDDGDDGIERYFTLWLLSTGPFLETSADAPAVDTEGEYVPTEMLLKPRTFEKNDRTSLPDVGKQDAPHVVQEVSSGNYYIRLEYYRVEPSAREHGSDCNGRSAPTPVLENFPSEMSTFRRSR